MLCLKQSKNVTIVPASGIGNTRLCFADILTPVLSLYLSLSLSLSPGTGDKYLEARMGRIFFKIYPRHATVGLDGLITPPTRSLTHQDSRNCVQYLDSNHQPVQ